MDAPDEGWRLVAPPIEFASQEEVEAFAELILDVHRDIQKASRCFGAALTATVREQQLSKIASIVENAFVGYFGCCPQERFDDVFSQASYLAYHLALDHIFADGNKRTALLIALSLPALHGVEWCFLDAASARDNDPYSWIQQVVSREKTEAQLAEQLRSWARLKTR